MSEIEQDPFIGQRFGEDGHLEVIGWDGKRNGSHKVYQVLCHKCKNDPELFQDGIFLCLRGNLVAGRLPCGCSKHPRWSKEQILIILKRSSEGRGVQVLPIESEWNGVRTPINLVCPSNGAEWRTTIQAFTRNLCSGCGCSRCRGVKAGAARTMSAELATKTFLKAGSFPNGTVFRKSDRQDKHGRRMFWWMYCPICKEEFEAYHTNLKRGARPCNCPIKGFKHSKPASFYVLKVVGDLTFTGYGVSNTITNRMYAHRTKLRKQNSCIDEMEIFQTTGEIAIKIEKMVKRKFEHYPQAVQGFITESTRPYLYDEVVSFVDSEILKLEASMDAPSEPCFDNDENRPEVDEKILEELGHNLIKEYVR